MKVSIVTAVALILIVGLTLSSCSNAPKTSEQLISQADTLIQKGKYEDGVRLLDELSRSFPKDTANIIKSAIISGDVYAASLNNYPKAIESLQKIVDRFPNESASATCLFKIGFTYENQVKDLVKAKQCYEDFLKRYPNHELALSVKLSLEHLGESDEELLERILKKNQTAAKQGK
jgi:outer membrane protein assembly factor BamD (BamD/ComL family)